MTSHFIQSSQRSSLSQLSDLGFTCDERHNSYNVGEFNMDRLGIFDFSFNRSTIIMGHCGNASYLRINVNPLIQMEGKFGLENLYCRMKNYHVLFRSNQSEQSICINPHIQIIICCGCLVRATNFSISMKNDKSECDFTDIVYKKVLKLKILHPTFVDMAFNNNPFVTLLRKKLITFAIISKYFSINFQQRVLHFLMMTWRVCFTTLSAVTMVL